MPSPSNTSDDHKPKKYKYKPFRHGQNEKFAQTAVW